MMTLLRRTSLVLTLILAAVNQAQAQSQTVSLTAPANNSTSPVNTTINLAATTTGSVTRVKFKQNGSYIGTGDSSAPYTSAYTPATSGAYVFVAEIWYSGDLIVASSPVTVTVTGGGNAAPTVSLTSPSNGASQAAPGSFTLTATAADSDGSIDNVKFYDGATLLATDNGSPYSHVLNTSVTGSHVLTAVATDNLGATATSAAVTVNVTSGGGTVSVSRFYVYDVNERLCKTIDPEAGATVVDYDAAGNIAWMASGLNLPSTSNCDRTHASIAAAKSTRTYDDRNRPLTVVTPGGTANVTTTYTSDGLVASLVASNGPVGANPVTTSYSYNKRRLLTAETSAQAGYVYAVGYAYDANAALSKLTYPDNQEVTYSPDALGRATAVKAGAQNYATAISYFPNGAISGFTYGNGAVHTLTQNARGLPTRSRDVKGATVVLDDTFAFDANGNVTDITDQAQAGLTTRGMAYDGLDRLTAALSPQQWGTATYTYDAIDNLRTANQGSRQLSYAYDANNRLSSISGTQAYTLGYDTRSNVTNKGAQDFTFDPSNRMMTAELLSGAGVQTYRYDGTGRRVQTTDPDGTTELWVYSQSGQVLYTHEQRRSQNLSYIYLGNTQVATRAMAFPAGTETIRYQHTDSLGSLVAETDSTGVVTKRNNYAPFGEAYGATSIDGTGYTGHVMDQGTGLTYMQQRYMDPTIGRFLSTDPVAASEKNGSNFNSFWYANNNPFSLSDPDGRTARTGYRHNPCGITGCNAGSYGPASNSSEKAVAENENFDANGVPNTCGSFGCWGWGYGTPGTMSDDDFGEALILIATIHPAGRTVSWLAKGARWAWRAKSGYLFGQATVKLTFKYGPHAGKTIGEVARGLRAGRISPNSLPVDYVIRDGQAVALNNRSLLALRRAGIEPTVTRNLTGNPAAEALVNSHLRGGAPSSVIRVRGGQANSSVID